MNGRENGTITVGNNEVEDLVAEADFFDVIHIVLSE